MQQQPPVQEEGLRGVITDCHLHMAEAEFPGITEFYRNIACKPRTFLELVWRFRETTERRRQQSTVRFSRERMSR